MHGFYPSSQLAHARSSWDIGPSGALLHLLVFSVPIVSLLAKLAQKVHCFLDCYHISMDEVPMVVPNQVKIA